MINERYAKKFCKDDISKIENYDKAVSDTTQIWDIHHRLELTLDGKFAHSRDELKRLGMYYDRPYFELVFLTHCEHASLHNKSKALSAEHRQKLSDAKKGRKRAPFTAEHRRNISASLQSIQFTAEHLRNITKQNDIITIDDVDFKQSKSWPKYYVSKLGSYVTVTHYRN